MFKDICKLDLLPLMSIYLQLYFSFWSKNVIWNKKNQMPMPATDWILWKLRMFAWKSHDSPLCLSWIQISWIKSRMCSSPFCLYFLLCLTRQKSNFLKIEGVLKSLFLCRPISIVLTPQIKSSLSRSCFFSIFNLTQYQILISPSYSQHIFQCMGLRRLMCIFCLFFSPLCRDRKPALPARGNQRGRQSVPARRPSSFRQEGGSGKRRR